MTKRIPIERYQQKYMLRIAENIRAEHFFVDSPKWERLPQNFCDDEDDQVYFSRRAVPDSVDKSQEIGVEVHTRSVKGHPDIYRVVDKVYVVK